jgi:hypothetical protein
MEKVKYFAFGYVLGVGTCVGLIAVSLAFLQFILNSN